MKNIRILGARTHNLKNISTTIPRDKLVVITGLSGSGKSSLAFDTLYAEGQRRYVESLSAYARQFLSMMSKPDVDAIEGLSPAIAIDQKSTSHNPRSTVGTITEIYDYLRLLYARVGDAKCPTHNVSLEAQSVSQMVDHCMQLPTETAIMILAPVVRNRKGEFVQLIGQLRQQGYLRARINGELLNLDDDIKLNLRQKHTIEVVVDRIKIRKDIEQRLADSIETALELGEGLMTLAPFKDAKFDEITFSAKHACPQCGHTIPELEPRYFSFNNPVGACSGCDGLGVKSIFDPQKIVQDPESSISAGAILNYGRNHPYHFQQLCALAAHYDFSVDTPFKSLPKKIRDCILFGSGEDIIDFKHQSANGKKFDRSKPFEGVIPSMTRRYHESTTGPMREDLAQYLTSSNCADCEGTRLQLGARYVFVGNTSLPTISAMTTQEAHAFFEGLKLKGQKAEIAEKILREIRSRLGFLIDVGLTYLTINRPAETLSGGEAQRIRLASQIGSGLVGVMYILDEPSIGLHQRDNERLIKTLTHLRDLGNTIIVVEHDEDTIMAADHVIDVGPGAGVHGGEIVAQGTAKQVIACKQSLTGQYLSGKKSIQAPSKRLENTCRQQIQIKGASCNNLQNVDVSFPIGLFTCVTGVSGSGKSSLLNDTLYPVAQQVLNKAKLLNSPGQHKSIKGLEYLDKVVDIDQSPIGRTPRSNPATYTGLFTPIRDLFSATVESRMRGYKPGRFSFNVKGGRCEACEGDGVIRVEMHFLADVYVTCDACKGKRYNRETLEVKYKDKTIHDVLEMTIETALEFFQAIPKIARKLQTLQDVGLSYIKLGQSATTLSGGEAQRIKLARELSKRDTGQTLYILDEPTTGLHFHDVDQLLKVLFKLRDRGNTLIVIEHNLDVIKVADWIIDVGPEGGSGGGNIVAAGTPETVSKCKASYTGKFLKKFVSH